MIPILRRLRASAYRWRYRRMWPVWRESEQDILHALVDPSKIAIDIGANRGQYALQLTELTSMCHSFECNPYLAAEMRKMFDGNSKLEIHEIAISDRDGFADLQIPLNGRAMADGESSLSYNERGKSDRDVKTINVQTARLDAFDFKNVGFIKIDVEGHELQVINGCIGTLMRERPIVLVECEERHNPGGIDKLAEVLGGLEYNIYFLQDGRLRPIDQFEANILQNPDSLLGRNRRRDMPYVNNFICSTRPLADRLG